MFRFRKQPIFRFQSLYCEAFYRKWSLVVSAACCPRCCGSSQRGKRQTWTSHVSEEAQHDRCSYPREPEPPPAPPRAAATRYRVLPAEPVPVSALAQATVADLSERQPKGASFNGKKGRIPLSDRAAS